MWLKLDLSGIKLSMQIRNYRKVSDDDWDSVWCKTDFAFVSDEWLNYRKDNDEVFLAREIEDLAKSLDDLLNDRLNAPTEFNCIEPDFNFILNPKKDLLAFVPKECKLPGFGSYGRETGGVMLSVTGLNHFYYVRDFTDMRCKHSRVLSIIRERLHREPRDGDVFIVMSRNRRIVRMFSFDNRSYSLFEKKFVAGYQFMKVERNGADTVYRIAWKDVVLILENPIVKTLKIR